MLRGPATGVIDDERDSTPDQLVEAASDSAVAFGVEAKAFEEIGPVQQAVSPAAPPSDTALELVLRSGCRDGLDQVRARRGNPSAPRADTVDRLCGDVLRAPAPESAAPGGTISERASANEGRDRLVLVATSQRPKAPATSSSSARRCCGERPGLLAAGAFAPNSSAEGVCRTGAIAMDVGLAVGIGMANSFDLSRNRVLIIDAGAVAGGLVGLGVAVLAGGNQVSGQAIAGGALGGLIAGIAVAAIATRHLDANDQQARAPAYPALFARGTDGHWAVGMPAPTPLLDTTGTRTVGASLPALGGVF